MERKKLMMIGIFQIQSIIMVEVNIMQKNLLLKIV